jgi:hypothetical protein
LKLEETQGFNYDATETHHVRHALHNRKNFTNRTLDCQVI